MNQRHAVGAAGRRRRRNHTRTRREDRAASLLRALVASTTDAIFAKDEQGRYVLVNDAAACVLGVAPGSALGFDDAAVFAPEAAAAIRANDREVMRLDGPRVFEERVPAAGGERIFLATKGPLRSGDRLLGMFGIARDVTAERRAVESLRASELRYRLAASGGHVWDWDARHGAIAVARGFWDQLGRAEPPLEQVREALESVIHPQDRGRWRAALRAHFVDRIPYRLDFRAATADGSWRHFRTQGQAVWDAHGRAVYMAGTTFDVTDQHRAEQRLLQSREELAELSRSLMEQERRSSRLLAQALHDHLGQTLASARLHLDVAAAASAPPALVRAGELLDGAIADVREMLDLLRPPLLEPLGLPASLEREVAGCARLGVQGILDAARLPRGQRWAEAVEYAVFMIGREAIGNALRHAAPARVVVSLSGDARHLALSVADDGRGIDADAAGGRAGRLGIIGMRERAHAIGAALTVGALPAGGTQVRLEWQEIAA